MHFSLWTSCLSFHSIFHSNSIINRHIQKCLLNQKLVAVIKYQTGKRKQTHTDSPFFFILFFSYFCFSCGQSPRICLRTLNEFVVIIEWNKKQVFDSFFSVSFVCDHELKAMTCPRNWINELFFFKCCSWIVHAKWCAETSN